MFLAFLYTESRAAEPVIPLVLFRNPIISVCSICAFVLGMGMFGVIIYLPLFMQGVLGVSATQSGNLLTPLMMARSSAASPAVRPCRGPAGTKALHCSGRSWSPRA